MKVKELYEYVSKLMEENKGECSVLIDCTSFAPKCTIDSINFDGKAIEMAQHYKIDDKEIEPAITFNHDRLYFSHS